MKYLWLLLLAVTAFGQNIRYDNVALGPRGPIPNASIAVCSQPAVTSTVPCTPLVSLCSSLADTSCTQPNPFFADALGNFHFYVKRTFAPVTVQIYGPGVSTPSVLIDQLAGTGANIGSAISITPSSISFGSVQTTTSSPPHSIIIQNTGGTTLTISSPTLTGSTDFSLVSPTACNGVFAPGASCTLQAVFAPTSATAETATVTINSNAPPDPNNPTANVVSLSGTGTASTTFPMTISCAGPGSGTVQSNDSPQLINAVCTNGAVSGSFSAQYAANAAVTITATSTDGGTNSLSCSSTSSCALIITAATPVTATFNGSAPVFSLNITGAGQGGGSITSNLSAISGAPLNCIDNAGVVSSGGGSGCSGDFSQGSTVTLTEVPNATTNPSTFVGWSGVPGCTTATTCVVTLSANTTVTANFAPTTSPISLVQTTTNCSVNSTTIACTWGSPQLAGDTNICFGGWPDATTTVVSVADTSSNTYTQFPTISPKVGTGLTQAAYYSQNIAAAAAGVNKTTMTLSTGVSAGISGTSLTGSGSTAGTSSYVTASITPASNNLVMLTFASTLLSGNGPGAISSVTGNGLTWVKVASVSYGATEGTGKGSSVEVWRAMGAAPSAGAVTVTFATSPTSVAWDISQFSGTDTTGTNGSGAIGIVSTNTAANAASPATVTMGTFGSAANGTFGAVGEFGNTVLTHASNMTDLSHNHFGQASQGSEWAAGNISPVTESYTDTSASWGAIGIEIKVPQNRRDMRCLEYSGLAGGVDVSIAAIGTGSAPSSGAITTTVANDLILGATLSTTSVGTKANGFTQQIKNTFGDDAEDVQGVASGTVENFQPLLTASGNWVVDLVGMKSSGTPNNTFSVTILGGNGNGTGLVSSSGGSPALNCNIISGVPQGPVCSTAVVSGSSITLNAAPATGVTFVGWQGVTGCSTGATCIIPNITQNQVVSAVFSVGTGWGSFAPGNWPTDAWRPFANSAVWNTRVPASPKLLTNSANIVSRLVTASGSNMFQTAYMVAPNSFDVGHPTFYSASSDQLWTISTCTSSQGGMGGLQLRIPSAARPAQGSDHHMTVVDQTNNQVWSFYQFPTTGTSGLTCCTLPTISACGVESVNLAGTGLGIHTTNAFFDNMAGSIRGEELAGGVINHALFMVVSCTNGATGVFPSGSNTGLACTNTTNAPTMGQMFWLDLTDAQIAALSVPAWEKTILTALSHYGAFIGDTGGDAGLAYIQFQFESGETYSVYGDSQPVIGVAQGAGIPLGSNNIYRFNFGSAVDWNTHLHVVDPCVPQGTC